MPRNDGLPPGTLILLILRVLAGQPLHGYALAQRIALLSRDELSVAMGRGKKVGQVKASPTVSDTGRQVREYRITPAGRKQLDAERDKYARFSKAIHAVLDNA